MFSVQRAGDLVERAAGPLSVFAGQETGLDAGLALHPVLEGLGADDRVGKSLHVHPHRRDATGGDRDHEA